MRLLLISMPWALFNRPSIQLSALKSYLGQHLEDMAITVRHPSLEVAAAIGTQRYQQIAVNGWAGEALYSGLLFPEQRQQTGRLFQRELKETDPTSYPSLLLDLEKQLTNFLERELCPECLLVGFSVCFNQLTASLWAAKKIKELRPHLPIVFGGSSCTPQMGTALHTVFPAVDYLISGEGEQPLRDLATFLLGRGPFPKETVFSAAQTPSTSAHSSAREVADLNTLPTPDYSDYFFELSRCAIPFIPQLPIEFSRGCWWNRCSFCNLNLQWQCYRTKKPERMAAEVKSLAKQYQCLDFSFTDNALPPDAARSFFQYMADEQAEFRFFAEVRAMQHPQQYALCRQAGLTEIQVGIEALSNSLLERMNKGTRVLDNIAAMKFALEQGIRLSGNLILEFPGSTTMEVADTMTALQAVFPYPPLQVATFFLGLGSPVHSQPRRFGLTAVTTHPKYRILFPAYFLSQVDMLIQSYRGDRQHQKKLWAPVRRQIAAWTDFHNRRDPRQPALCYRDGSDFLLIRQERAGQPTLHHRLRGLSRKIYLQCRQPVRQKELLQTFNRVKEEQLKHFLADLAEKGLLFQDQDACLALAVHAP
ncbi:RiPP maturation radical SAM C-methyltransferase [Desulfobulbus alkaliphilus]|uniref:RiPP maturation radical SAM C-methyltransferase n=1 Tax=Desulfobulbus alkaliphilus TaxID=869814 RepID=UPI0019636D9E|nr:RiPP maturation radical SAM C-methyltransferase [Desulfobulbus alkaliphilus]MBM9537354.1 RiPP maturation radical SAM C-methyltransferase [Desulfobulbus alkaliphilus]